MTDPAQDTQASTPLLNTTPDFEIPPSTGWVVHELLRSRSGLPTVWAWCQVSDADPGYSRIVYTGNDGVTAIDPGPNPQLGPVIVKVFC